MAADHVFEEVAEVADVGMEDLPNGRLVVALGVVLHFEKWCKTVRPFLLHIERATSKSIVCDVRHHTL